MPGDAHATRVWILLLLATAATWFLGVRPGEELSAHSGLADAVILVIAGLKIWLVLDGFMELRECSARVRWAARTWLLVLLGSLLFLLAWDTPRV